MENFGVRFAIHSPGRFELLRALYAEIKRDKDADQFRGLEEWSRMVPDEIKGRFAWPAPGEQGPRLDLKESVATAIPEPFRQLAARWDFDSVFEAFESGEYDLLGCESVGPGVGEMHIDPHAYPYGGVGPFIALAEAFGFTVLGVNAHGKYQGREELLAAMKGS